jgi:predicted RNase H-like HicB family nuclease
MRQVLLYRDEDGYWIAESPSLKGCISQGETKEIALINIKEAINGYIKALEEDNIIIPVENFDALLVAV